MALKRKQKAFTLIELLVVIAIIALLASIVLVALNGARQKSRDAKRIGDIREIANAVELYNSDNNTYPQGGFDSRNSNQWQSFQTLMAPYIAALPLPPDNGSGDGAMCGNCDEYNYSSNNPLHYTLITYLASTANSNASNQYGPEFELQQ
jgi:prepilin-type N-terminal cleavage/methylation domain-containing protein